MSKITEIKKVTLMQVIDARTEMLEAKQKVGSGVAASAAYNKACERYTSLYDIYAEQNPSMERLNRPDDRIETEGYPQKSKPKNFRPRGMKKDQVIDNA